MSPTEHLTEWARTYGNYSLKRVILVRLEIEGIMDGKESTKSSYGQDDGEYRRSLFIFCDCQKKVFPTG